MAEVATVSIPVHLAAIAQLQVWFERDMRFAKWNRDVELVSLNQENGEVFIKIYTDLHEYRIHAKPGADYGVDEPRLENIRYSYLGCQVSSRKPRAGETWARGNDCADGPLNERTWHSILADIVSYELVRIHPREQARGVPDAAPANTELSALDLAAAARAQGRTAY